MVWSGLWSKTVLQGVEVPNIEGLLEEQTVESLSQEMEPCYETNRYKTPTLL